MTAVVLSCLGASEGDLNLVRSLGEAGVPVIVLSEYAEVPAGRSRHCSRLIVAPEFTTHPERLLAALQRLRRELGHPPVVFPSADPDLHVLIALMPQLKGVALSTVLSPELSAQFSDKARFHELAERTALPVPGTWTMRAERSVAQEMALIEAHLGLPLILKPSHPVAWHDPRLPEAYGRAKALPIEDVDTLQRCLTELGPVRAHTLVQDLVVGGDEQHFDVHAYIDHQGRPAASYAGRKWRVCPPHAGSGCFVESVCVPELEDEAVDMLMRLGYRGFANINYKRDVRTGAFRLFEINPRVSQWHILATRSGVNLPLMAYRDVLGLPTLPPPARRFGVRYVSGGRDWRAARIYRREGLLSWPAYVRSLLHWPLVCQYWQLSDPAPAWAVFSATWGARFRRCMPRRCSRPNRPT